MGWKYLELRTVCAIWFEAGILKQLSIFSVGDVEISKALVKAGMDRIKLCGKSGVYIKAQKQELALFFLQHASISAHPLCRT
jgi:hypothetical protein